MNLFELFVKIGVDDQASKNISNIAGKLGNGLKTAAKIGTAAITAAATGITALTTKSVKNYAEYEQLVGGVETLFSTQQKTVEEYAEAVGESVENIRDVFEEQNTAAQKVVKNANKAYKTAGMSVNEYMSTVTSFSASLLQSLGNNTTEAARYADQAVIDMSDNANKMGTSMEMIQNAYQGFAKQNYTMLDNLKLGYGGTKTEMERLIADANRVKEANGEMANLTISSFADVVEAIHTIQSEMGIAGATALEAGTTIEGSVNSAKAAWENLVTGLADSNADIETLMDEFITTIVGDGTENNLGVFKNIMPAAETALNGVGKLIDELFPLALGKIPAIVSEYLPKITKSAGSMIESFIEGIRENKDEVSESAISVVDTIIDTVLGLLPDVFSLGFDLILSLADGIADNIDELIPTATETVLNLAEYLLDNSDKIIDVGYKLIESLIDGISNAEEILQEKAPELVEKFVAALVRNLPKMIKMGMKMITSMNTGMFNNTNLSTETIRNIIEKIIETIKNIDWKQVGRDIIDSFSSGVKERRENILSSFKSTINPAIEWIKDIKQRALTWGKDMIQNFISGIKSMWNSLVNVVRQTAQKVKNYLGFSEPKEGPLSNFHTYAPDMMNLFAKGIRDNEDVVIDQVKKSFDLRKHIGVIEPEVSGIANIGSYGGYGGTTTEKSVSVVQNIYSEAKSAADLMQEALYFQERSVMLGV